MTPYDEFGLFGENVAEYGLSASATPVVRRESVRLPDGRAMSALVWGEADPVLVLVHGTGQNAHTWDTVALDLGVPLVAVDLPGHGHSDWRDDATYQVPSLADDLAVAVRALAPTASLVVGMSLGGLVCLSLADRHPALVPRLVLVDVTPGVTSRKAKAVLDFINGPQRFDSFDDLLARTIEHNPSRSESSLRRGILHNARQLEDGSWAWRYDRRGRGHGDGDPDAPRPGADDMWRAIGEVSCHLTLVRGGASPVVDDDDVAELLRRRPDAVVHVVDGAGHSVQGDRPRELAALLRPLLPAQG
jgi:pimeloyl-ACP methyl ester carboxylesterase